MRLILVPADNPASYLSSDAELSRLFKARSIALTSTERQRHGAVIFSGRKLLAVGVNTYRNHPLAVTNPKIEASYHAEANALKQLKYNELNPKSLRLFIVRVNNAGELMPSRPCNNCYDALVATGFFKVIYHT
jgi:deoxycytidylate deaminase